MRGRFALLAGAVLLLAACGSDPAGDEPAGEVPGSAAGQPGSPEATLQEEEKAGSTAVDAAGSSLGSAYTDLDLDRCEMTRQLEEGDSATWRCPGYEGVPLIVHSGDGRFDIDAGSDNGEWESIMAFNDVPGTVEWRLVNGRPSAIIYRLRDVSGMAGSRSVLMVEAVGAKDRPGCLLARIAGDTPDANEVARRHADGPFGNAPCQNGKVASIGNAG